MKVSAEDAGHVVSFNYNVEMLCDNTPISTSMRNSIENRSVYVKGEYLTSSDVVNPSSLFNGYYKYNWTHNGQIVDIYSFRITEDMHFELQWTPVKYYVNFIFPNSEIKSMVTNLVEQIEFTIESPRINLYEPKVPNYKFDGWFNGDVPYDMLYIPAGSVGSKNLTARLSLIEYPINYNTDAKNFDNPKTYNVNDGEIILVEPSKEGHIFKGWYTDASYTTEVTTIDCSVGGAINLYPLWELETYTVKYILPNGAIKEIEVEYGHKADLPKLDKSIFQIVSTDISRNNITKDTTIEIQLVNIWYVYVLGIMLIIGCVVAIVIIKKKRDVAHDNLRTKYFKDSSKDKSSLLEDPFANSRKNKKIK